MINQEIRKLSIERLRSMKNKSDLATSKPGRKMRVPNFETRLPFIQVSVILAQSSGGHADTKSDADFWSSSAPSGKNGFSPSPRGGEPPSCDADKLASSQKLMQTLWMRQKRLTCSLILIF